METNEIFDTKEYWKQKYLKLEKQYKELYSEKVQENKQKKLVKIKIYEVPSVIFKLHVCKALSEIWRLNYVNASKQWINMNDWYKIIAFINSASEEKKAKFYEDMNDWEFII